MMALKQAREIQRERETQTLIKFIAAAGIFAVVMFLLVYLTDIFEQRTAFYIIPMLIFALIVKKTDILTFFTAKEFVGTVCNIDVYVVKQGKVKGEHSYETRQYETLEAEIIIKNEKKTAIKTLPHSDVTAGMSVGDRVAFLRFIDQPILLNRK